MVSADAYLLIRCMKNLTFKLFLCLRKGMRGWGGGVKLRISLAQVVL